MNTNHSYKIQHFLQGYTFLCILSNINLVIGIQNSKPIVGGLAHGREPKSEIWSVKLTKTNP